MKDLMELMQKKGTPVNPKEKSSKMEVVHELRKLMSQLIKEDMSQEDPEAQNVASAVTVEAPDQESLEMGLDKAKDVVSSMPEDMMVDEEDEDEDLFS